MIDERATQRIIYRLSKKYGLSVSQIEDIVKSPSRMVRQVMKSGSLKSVQIPRFGRYELSLERQKFLHEQAEKKKSKQTS